MVRVRMLRWAAACALALFSVVPCAASAVSAAGTIAVPVITVAPDLDPHAGLDAWKDAAVVALPWDVQHQTPSSEATSARIATDGTNLFVRFDATQREALLAQQHTNEIGDGT